MAITFIGVMVGCTASGGPSGDEIARRDQEAFDQAMRDAEERLATSSTSAPSPTTINRVAVEDDALTITERTLSGEWEYTTWAELTEASSGPSPVLTVHYARPSVGGIPASDAMIESMEVVGALIDEPGFAGVAAYCVERYWDIRDGIDDPTQDGTLATFCITRAFVESGGLDGIATPDLLSRALAGSLAEDGISLRVDRTLAAAG